jgi:hypothetical protein
VKGELESAGRAPSVSSDEILVLILSKNALLLNTSRDRMTI